MFPCPTVHAGHPLAVPAGRTEAEQSSGTCAAGYTGSTTLERTRAFVARVYALHIAQGQRTGVSEDRKPGTEGPWSAWTTVASSCTPIATSTGGGGGSDDDDDGNWPSTGGGNQPSAPTHYSAGPGGYNNNSGTYVENNPTGGWP